MDSGVIAVAHAVHRHDEPRLFRIRLNAFAKLRNVLVQGAAVVQVTFTPGMGEDLTAFQGSGSAYMEMFVSGVRNLCDIWLTKLTCWAASRISRAYSRKKNHRILPMIAARPSNPRSAPRRAAAPVPWSSWVVDAKHCNRQGSSGSASVISQSGLTSVNSSVCPHW